ncbi:TMPIT-like protein [Haematococcus lacustris]
MATQELHDKVLAEASALLSKSRGLSQRVATYSNRLVGESDSLAVEIKSLQQAISSAEKAARALCANTSSQRRPKGVGGEATTTTTTTTSTSTTHPEDPGYGTGGLALLLGDKVSVVAFRADQSAAMKEEYHKFRDRAALVMLVVPLLLVLGMRRADTLRDQAQSSSRGGVPQLTFTPGLMTVTQLYLLWLGYFYLALALRENVLLVNGSAIKPWWIQHHYWSASCALLLLGLPVYSPAVYTFCEYFLMWSCFQALVMMVQNHYQRRRMYTRIALGKSSAMDVVGGESSGATGQLLVLYPMLIMLQLSQGLIGAGVIVATGHSLFASEGWLDVEAAGSDLRGMRGVCLVGCTFCYMAIRNFLATAQTLMDKRRYARTMKKSRSTKAAKLE